MKSKRQTATRTNKPRNPRPRAINDNYRSAPYTGNELEVVTTLSHNTNRPDVLEAVAAWHEMPWRRGIRHSIIAEALRSAAEAGRRSVA